MASQTANLHVQIVRFVMDHQPPIVACEFVDADGHCHTFIDKVGIFSEETLDADSRYPQAGVIRCVLMTEWWDSRGRGLIKINTAEPDQLESTAGLTDFVVLRGQISATPSRANLR